MTEDRHYRALQEAIRREAVSPADLAARREAILNAYADLMGFEPAQLNNEARREQLAAEAEKFAALIEATDEARQAQEDEQHFDRFGW